MVATDPVEAIFADARVLYEDALEQLESGKLRNAAEKAWGATKRATDALILARIGELPRTSGRTSRRIFEMGQHDPDIDALVLRCDHRQRQLHGRCFYNGNCEPEDRMADLVRETVDYIQDAEALAASRGP